ncbi:MAG: ABC transporter permease [Chloroflexota bacterium]|nr:ABC transporter permease [Chloroflexota bacterium]
MDNILSAFSLNLLGPSLRLATPILLAALGGLFTQQAGVLNIALEGLMLTAAFFGAAGAYYTHNAWLGLLAGVLASMALSAVFGVFSIQLRADLVVAGIAVNLFAAGATLVLLQRFFHTKGNFSPGARLPNVRLEFIRDVPVLGHLFAQQNILVYVGLVLIAVSHIVLYRTPFGLRVRSVGENPEAAETAGVPVQRIQFATVLISGVLCGLAGVNLSLGYLSEYTTNMTAGRGFIALAAQTFGNATPVGTAVASIFFGFTDALSVRLQTRGLPSQFVLMLPYLATVAALVLVARRHSLLGRRQTTVDAEHAEATV